MMMMMTTMMMNIIILFYFGKLSYVFGKTSDILMLLINMRTLFYLKKLIGITPCRLVSLICIPAQSIDHIFGTVAMGTHKPHMSDKLRTKQIKHIAVNRANPLDQLPSGHQFMLCFPPYRTVSAVRHTIFFFVEILVAGCSSRCQEASQQRRTCLRT